MELAKAQALAVEWVEDFAPKCERIEIAGSVRRCKPDVHDIEIVAIPKVVHNLNLWGENVGDIDLLGLHLDVLNGEHAFSLLKNGPRYKQIALPEGVNIDLFLVRPPAQWGVIMMIRTGPAEFSHWMVTPRENGGPLPRNCSVADGQIWKHANMEVVEKIPMPEEADYFAFCGLPWIEPKDRLPRWGKAAPLAAALKEEA